MNGTGYPPVAALGKIDMQGSSGPFDVILVSGDAYVDHPAFPAAAVARRLEALGASVAVIAQPDWKSTDAFRAFGKPNLFFGVTAGAMDSMVSNYTSMKMPRREDRLSPGGRTGLRPKRAVQVYTQRLREAFPGVPIVLGGIEASLRRFAHYDFWEDKIRDPMLVDAPASLLVYGMAESVLGAVVDWYRSQASRERGAWPTIPQTCVRVPHDSWRERLTEKVVILPSTEECRSEPRRFMELSVLLDTSVRPDAPILVQPHPKGDVLSFPPSRADLTTEPGLLDHLRFLRRTHPVYDEKVPGLEPVQFSVVSHRGCLGACAFCALAAHQGRIIRSRSPEEILKEIRSFTRHPDFRGTVPDVGGPSVNMYGWECGIGGCETGICTHPRRCGNIRGGLSALADLLKQAREIPGIRHVFLGSGLRYDLIRDDDWPAFLDIIRHHISGQLKVAPEHVDRDVLRLMRKGADANFPEFVARFMREAAGTGQKLFLIPYFMTAFPGSAGKDGAIAETVRRLRLAHEQIQEFTPTPATIGTAMYATGLTPDGKPVLVSRSVVERSTGRREIQPGNRRDGKH